MKRRILSGLAGLAVALSAAASGAFAATAPAGLPDFPGVAVPSIRAQLQDFRAGSSDRAALRADEVGDEHLAMGNPSGAVEDPSDENDYLLRKPEYVLSYNNGTGTPNWVSWHLNSSWLGTTKRSNNFRPDPALPSGFIQVTPRDYVDTGFDKGHMCNSEDRSRDPQSNSETFLMSNMIPQSPRNNEHTWAALEDYSRTLAKQGDELYIVSGPSGQGGVGKNGPLSAIPSKSGGSIVVPALTWKVILVLPSGVTSPQDVTADAKTIAVIMPNTQDIGLDWKQYIVTVADVENLTHYNFFSAVDPAVAAQLKQQKYQP
jgi:endonuclease G